MKNIAYLLPLLMVIIACNNNNQFSPNELENNSAIEDNTLHHSSPKDAAPAIARSFVKSNFANDSKFEHDFVIENTMVTNRYKVMQKFKSKKHGVELTYVYKIFIQYFEGNVDAVSSWDFNQLIIEDASNGKRTYFKGDLDNRIKKTVGIGNTVNYAGVEFKIVDVRFGTSIAFSHKGKLSRKQIADALKEMHDTYKYESYHIYHDNNLKEDYIQWQATGNLTAVFDFEKDKIYETLEDYVKGKAIM